MDLSAFATPENVTVLINAIGALVGAVILWAGRHAIGWLKSRKETQRYLTEQQKLAVAAELERLLQGLAEQAADFAEEHSRKALKLDNFPVPGEAKMAVAIQQARKRAVAAGAPVDDNALRDLIESALGKQRRLSSNPPPPDPAAN